MALYEKRLRRELADLQGRAKADDSVAVRSATSRRRVSEYQKTQETPPNTFHVVGGGDISEWEIK